MAPVLAYESNITSINVSSIHWMMIGGISFLLLFVQLILLKPPFQNSLQLARIGWILIGMAMIGITVLLSTPHIALISILVFAIVATEEAIGRWLFYQSRTQPLT